MNEKYINVDLNGIHFKAKYNPEKIQFEYNLTENLLFVLNCVSSQGGGAPVPRIKGGSLIYRIYYKDYQIYSCPVYPYLFSMFACNDNLFEKENYSFKLETINERNVHNCDIENLSQELKNCFPETDIEIEKKYINTKNFNRKRGKGKTKYYE